MALTYTEAKVWDPGLFDEPPRTWEVSSVGALLHVGRLERGQQPSVLIVHRVEDDTWGLPAGRIEPEDKNLEGAVVREVGEETGIALDEREPSLFCVDFHPFRAGVVRCVFAAQLPRNSINDGGQMTDWGWEMRPNRLNEEVDRLGLIAVGRLFVRYPDVKVTKVKVMGSITRRLESMRVV